MENIFIGRQKEKEILQKALQSKESEMVSVIGRRRIGKTFLIKNVYQNNIVFELTGTKNAPLKEQLQNFIYALQLSRESNVITKAPENWMEAFFMLINYLKQLPKSKKKVVFLDELPWLSTHRSGFLRAMSFFWNSWAVNHNIVVVICGSAASWMIQKVVNDKGGLHNRITRRIYLKPFSLSETEEYLQNRSIKLNRYQLLQLYMVMGGIPHYLKEIETGKSATQNINDICFEETGLLRDEFSNLYGALFSHSDNHISVVRTLAKKKIGMDRTSLIKAAKLSNGGTMTKILEELRQSGFIEMYLPFGKKANNKIYRLTDEYSLFYLQFIEKNIRERDKTWQQLSQTQAYKIWCGYAFENICLKHISQIKKALSIGGVYAAASSFYKKGTKKSKGTQIDLLLDRNDQSINIFEIKFHNKAFTISKSYAQTLKNKLHVFEETTKTHKHLFLTLITSFGIVSNEHSLGLIDQVLTMDDLFE
ncbi:MAG TPA: ATP-binding protein [Saprospiraceae bacterium]|nr:ATP-binding protein [Saprospiraceae bacterium]